MSLKTLAQLALVAGFAVWTLNEYPLPSWAPRIDTVITGSVERPPVREAAPAPAAEPAPEPADAAGPAPVIITEGSFVEAAPPEPEPEPIIVAQATDVETTPDEPAPAPAPTSAARSQADRVDESALRYFARTGDTRRLNAEIARLRTLHPGWEPPDDPAAPEVFTDPELDRMWELFSEGRYAEVRAAIAERRGNEADWQPPAALTDLLDQAERRVRLTNASDAGQWATVIDIAAETPALLTCSYVDVLWRLAEAFAETAREDRAKDAYTYLLQNCENPAERLATVQKAAELLPAAAVNDLLLLERGDEFRPARDDIVRRRVGVLAEVGEGTADTADIARLEELAEDSTDAGDALLLGWYNYRRGNGAEALDWFETARERDPKSAKAAEGNTLALIDLERFGEAEAVGYDWSDESEENRAAYLSAVTSLLGTDPPPKLSEAVLKRMVAAVVREKDAEAGEQMAWYAYNLGQVQSAERWFETVLKWSPDYEPAAYGLVVARLARNDRAGANAIIREWAGRSPRIERLSRPSKASLDLPAYVVDAPMSDSPDKMPTAPAGYAPAPAPVTTARCGGTAPVATLSPAAAIQRGWCLMDLNRPVEAVAAFEIASRSPDPAVRSDAAYGASLANLRSGVTDKAAVAAASAPLPGLQAEELNVSILTQHALAMYTEGRYAETILALDERSQYAPEQNDLMVLRGYAYLKLRRYGDAKRLFQAVAATGDPDGIRGLADVQAIQNGIYQ